MTSTDDSEFPMPLQDWIDRAYPADTICPAQCLYVRDVIAPMLWRDCSRSRSGLHEEVRRRTAVVSSHRSRSVRLPVYDIVRPEIGIRVVLRDNFFNWKMSVVSESPIDVDLRGLCWTSPPPPPEPDDLVHFEGFPADLVFPHYDVSDRKRWSAELGNQEVLWATMFLVLRAAGVIQPFETLMRRARGTA
jgi:hypothetical protein